MDFFALQGKVVVVTGGAQGIGAAIASHYAAAGAKVAVLDVDLPHAEHVVAALPTSAIALACDVRDGAALAVAAARAEVDLGPIDVWVNNAGGIVGGANAALTEIDPAVWQQIFDLNLTSVMLGSQIAARSMIDRGAGGAIVNLASFQGTNASPHMTPYGAAKAGVIHFTKTAALELAPHRIRVNAIAPSFVLTPAAEREMTPERKAASIQAIPSRGRDGQRMSRASRSPLVRSWRPSRLAKWCSSMAGWGSPTPALTAA